MEKAVDDFRKELSSLRTGRANTSLLDHIRVDYHGTSMPVNQLGSVTFRPIHHDYDYSVGSRRRASD